MNLQDLLQRLPLVPSYAWDREAGDMVPVNVRPTAFIRDGLLIVSGEDGLGLVDYYGEDRGGDPWIHPALVDWADDLGLYWEWESPGAICLAG